MSILVTGKQWSKRRTNRYSIFIASWSLQTLTNSVRSQARAELVSMHHGHFTSNGWGAVFARILGRSNPLLKVPWISFGPHTDCTGTTYKRLFTIDTEGRLHLQGLYRLLGSSEKPGRLGISAKATKVTCRLQLTSNMPLLKSFLSLQRVWMIFIHA